MIRDVLQTIPGISTFPVIGLLLFLVAFAVIMLWVIFRVDKDYSQLMKQLPLEDEPSSSVGE